MRGALVLASASPRRLALLRQVSVPVEVVPADVDETQALGEAPMAYAERVAVDKARTAMARLEREDHPLRAAWVLAADTVVIVDGEALGKPEDDEHARRLITRLAGRGHEVVTAVAIGRAGAPLDVEPVRTRVFFRPLTEAEVAAYVATGEGRDKAGAYGIQGIGAGLVTHIEGCYFNVVGLPLSHTLGRLVALGAVRSWP
ncbi:MAG: septum formation protein Maf [Sandaracinaceae bacterium]|nr:septum formation protein Maf [Myxococcales bacterium]MCB9659051.1 septum formation protein Maf [Sandaracinaceae bacterium]